MSHAARAFRLELLQLYRSVPSSRVFSHIFRVRVPPERSPIYRNVPPFSSLTPRTIVLLAQLSARTRHNCRLAPDTIVGSHQTSEGNAVDLALSHGAAAWGRDDLHDETQGRRASSERARAFQWSIPRLAQLESSNPPK